MYPCNCSIADCGGGAKKALDGGEAELVDDRPQDGGVVGVEDYLVAFDGGARGARGGIEGLAADEAGELVVGFEVGVILEDGSSELADGCGGGDVEAAEADARLGEASGGLREGDAGQRAACDLIGSEDSTAIEADEARDVDLDKSEVGLDESVVDGHVGGQVLEAFAEHTIEGFEDCTEVSPLGADVHLPSGAERDDRLDRGFADDGASARLPVDVLTDFAADFGVDAEDFCHNTVEV